MQCCREFTLVELAPLPGNSRPRRCRFTQKGLDMLKRAGAEFTILEQQLQDDDGNMVAAIHAT